MIATEYGSGHGAALNPNRNELRAPIMVSIGMHSFELGMESAAEIRVPVANRSTVGAKQLPSRERLCQTRKVPYSTGLVQFLCESQREHLRGCTGPILSAYRHKFIEESRHG